MLVCIKPITAIEVPGGKRNNSQQIILSKAIIQNQKSWINIMRNFNKN